ncbi:unnamed protein product [Sympodiomycopsis kandeliae]
MDFLAADLQEATSDLLDLPSTSRNSSPSKPRNRHGQGLKVESHTSRLKLIQADGEDWQRLDTDETDRDRPLVGPSGSPPALPLEAPEDDSESVNEAPRDSVAPIEYSDRFESLSSRTAPIRPSSASRHTPVSLSSSSRFPSGLEAHKESALGLKTSSSAADIRGGNVWLNERGERVLDGDVIGRLSLADQAVDTASSGHDSLAQDGGTRSGQHTPATNRLSRDFDHKSHAASQRLYTPDFFLRSFPSKEKVDPVTIEDPLTKRYEDSVQFLDGLHSSNANSSQYPNVTLTFAQTIDGCISGVGGQQLILSGQESMAMTHVLRTLHDGILVGIGTVLNDDPRLSARLIPHSIPVSDQPRPIILDSSLRTPLSCKLITNFLNGTGRQPLILTTETSDDDVDKSSRMNSLITKGSVGIVPLPSLDWPSILSELHTKVGIKNLMVEGGAGVIESLLLSQHLINSLIITVSPTFAGSQGTKYQSVSWQGQQDKSLNVHKKQFFGQDSVWWWRR